MMKLKVTFSSGEKDLFLQEAEHARFLREYKGYLSNGVRGGVYHALQNEHAYEVAVNFTQIETVEIDPPDSEKPDVEFS
jgi:hypothetical protein